MTPQDMTVIAGYEVSTAFLWAAFFSCAILAAIMLEMRLFRRANYNQMSWMDWCGYCALVGIPMALVGGVSGFDLIRNTGVLLLFPLYPIAFLGLIGKLDDMRVSFMRGWRKR